jgi:hypothetical protein
MVNVHNTGVKKMLEMRSISWNDGGNGGFDRERLETSDREVHEKRCSSE